MLKIGAIGLGNCGGQIVALANAKSGIAAVAINSSETDLNMIPAKIPKILIKSGEKAVDLQGAGQNRDVAKSMLRASIENVCRDTDIYNLMMNSDLVFVVSSTGGGTGSGTAPILVNVLNAAYPGTKIILIGVQPVISSAGSNIFNAIEYSKEVCNVVNNVTYMMYDNNKAANMKLPLHEILKKVNDDVVDDMVYLSGFHNTPTIYDSIDDKDNLRLLSAPGYMTVAAVRNIHEKDLDSSDLEDMVIEAIKKNTHVDLQRDKIISEMGLIYHLSSSIASRFDSSMPKLKEFVGQATIQHTHTVINNEKSEENFIIVILTGCSDPSDHFEKLDDRIEEINALQDRLKDDYSFQNSEVDAFSEKLTSVNPTAKVANEIENIDMDSLFSQVMK